MSSETPSRLDVLFRDVSHTVPNRRSAMTVIDIHTHMLSEAWVDLVRLHGEADLGQVH